MLVLGLLVLRQTLDKSIAIQDTIIIAKQARHLPAQHHLLAIQLTFKAWDLSQRSRLACMLTQIAHTRVRR